jgi:hypothetical protein
MIKHIRIRNENDRAERELRGKLSLGNREKMRM